MPTIFSHAAVGFIAAKGTAEATGPNTKVLITSIVFAALPDVDGVLFGTIPYNHPFGHRGFTHSLVFALLTGLLGATVFSKAGWAPANSFVSLAVLFSVVTASHGFFDAMTDGGLGVAFFAPFNNIRYFFPWRPIAVAPMSIKGLINARGLRVLSLETELFWMFAIGAAIWDRKTRWRIVASTIFAIVGFVCWILALNRE